MTDWFSKMVCAILLGSISALTIAKFFVCDLLFVYELPDRLISDKYKQFIAKLFQSFF